MKILLICQDNIGDLVFTTALIDAISTMKEEVEIQVLTRCDTAEVAEFFAHIESIFPQIALSKLNPITRIKTVRAYFKTLNWIKSQHFDLALSVSKNWRLGLLMRQANIPMRIGFAHPKLKPWLTHSIDLPDLQKPVVTELLTLLKPLGINSTITRYALDMPKVQSMRRACLSQLEVKKSDSQEIWFGLHAFASQQNRCVDISVWFVLSEEILKQGKTPIWFGAPKDMEHLRAYNNQHNEGKHIGKFCDQLCSGQLSQSIPLLSLCDAYVGHDSGILHLASAMGLKTLGIFTPGEPFRTFAQGTGKTMTLHRPTPQEVDGSLLIKYTKKCFPEYLI